MYQKKNSFQMNSLPEVMKKEVYWKRITGKEFFNRIQTTFPTNSFCFIKRITGKVLLEILFRKLIGVQMNYHFVYRFKESPSFARLGCDTKLKDILEEHSPDEIATIHLVIHQRYVLYGELKYLIYEHPKGFLPLKELLEFKSEHLDLTELWVSSTWQKNLPTS